MSKAKSEKLPKFPIDLSGKMPECCKFLLKWGGGWAAAPFATHSPTPMLNNYQGPSVQFY